MSKNLTKPKTGSFERKTLLVLSVLFVGVMISAWIWAMNLREMISANNSVVNVDVGALIELEKIRNVAEAQISNSRAFFLLGSSKLFDQQKEDKQALTDSLANFQKKYSLPQVPEIVKRIEGLQQQHQEIFDQGMEFRAQQTESKIVGQFYQSKAGPLRDQINKSIDEIATLHKAELERAQARAREAVIGPQVQIPQGMAWLTAFTSILFLGMALLVIKVLRERARQLAERSRLYEEAQKAILTRDEVIASVSQDLKEPLNAISQTAQIMSKPSDQATLTDGVELIQSSVNVIQGQLKDVLDQTKAESGSITLRLDQLGIDSVLEEARLMLQPMAKQKDIRIEINPVNPPPLAFFDRERVIRVLANLLGNAVKFSPRNSKVFVRVKSDQQFVYVSVKDSGSGIPEKQQEGLFDQYWQARKTADQGPGVGLAIVKTIVEAHGGTVTVESHLGSGSTFTFTLPRRRPAGFNMGKPTSVAVKPGVARSLDSNEFTEGPTA